MLTVYYHTPLVVVSILVAIFASYTALSLAERVAHTQGVAARWWIAGGALAMGIGIWSMHFIGMLAFRLPIAVGYDLAITMLSLLLPVLVSGLALWQVSQLTLPIRRLAGGAVLMGIGINAMHYTGMAAMRMQPGITYDIGLFAASVAIAIGASGAALWIAFRLRHALPNAWLARGAAAAVMGLAIVGMHYTGMAAASFPLGSICMAAQNGFSQDGLAMMVIVTTLAVLTIALLTSIFDARLAAGSKNLAMSQATARERQVLLDRERSAREHAERVNILKDEFLATLSHELRTPLSAILGWSQILQRGAKDEAALMKGLDTIDRNARAQVKLIDDLLDMSKIISGKIHLDMQPIDPAAFVEAALESARPLASAKRISLESNLDHTTGVICGDTNRLQQVMWNLLSNAVKFTPEGGTIRVVQERRGNEALLQVTDSGIGIPANFLPHVFDRFRQADASTTRRYGGLGLGLAIVRQLVELHGGSIEAYSDGPDKGATFTLYLPLLKNPKFKEPDGCEVSPALADTQDIEPADLTGVRVLVIDDQLDALEVTKRLLQTCGAEVLIASNAMEGFALIEQWTPNLVISDIGMPDMDGIALIRGIRAATNKDVAGVPAIGLSAFTRDEDHYQALHAGFDAYMTKPISASALLATVAELAKRTITDFDKHLST
jgi:signal transduction histidine kinase/ActR/RegA family two-component response regulator